MEAFETTQVRADGGSDQVLVEKARHLLRILVGSQSHRKGYKTTHELLATKNLTGMLFSVISCYCWYLS